MLARSRLLKVRRKVRDARNLRLLPRRGGTLRESHRVRPTNQPASGYSRKNQFALGDVRRAYTSEKTEHAGLLSRDVRARKSATSGSPGCTRERARGSVRRGRRCVWTTCARDSNCGTRARRTTVCCKSRTAIFAQNPSATVCARESSLARVSRAASSRVRREPGVIRPLRHDKPLRGYSRLFHGAAAMGMLRVTTKNRVKTGRPRLSRNSSGSLLRSDWPRKVASAHFRRMRGAEPAVARAPCEAGQVDWPRALPLHYTPVGLFVLMTPSALYLSLLLLPASKHASISF